MMRPDSGHRFPIARRLIVLALGLAALNVAAGTPVHGPDKGPRVDETAITSAAVIAVDDHWSLAELRGDTAWLDSMLLPDYRSVRADGSIWDKKALLARAAANRGSQKLKEFDAWLKGHPIDESVTLHGNVAVLMFSDPRTGRVRGSNVFVHEGGRWLALFSQQAKTK